MNRFDTLLGLIGLVGSVAVLTLSFWLSPDPRGYGTHEQLGLAPCSFLAVHGIPCLSCGMTTAFAGMAHLRPDIAVAASPFGALLFLVCLGTPWHCVRCLRQRRDPVGFLVARRTRWIGPVGLVLMLANWAWMVWRHQHLHA